MLERKVTNLILQTKIAGQTNSVKYKLCVVNAEDTVSKYLAVNIN